MKVFFIRHGDKIKGDYYNDTYKIHDFPLSEIGKAESEELVTLFKNVKVDTIYVSQYQRTFETIKLVARDKNLVPIVDKRLNEIDGGDIYGLSEEEIKVRYPEFWVKYNKLSEDFIYPNGESGDDVLARIKDFLNEQKNSDGQSIAVTHEGLMRTMMCAIFDKPSYRRFNMKVDTCGIIEIEYDKKFEWWKLIRFNYKYNLADPFAENK